MNKSRLFWGSFIFALGVLILLDRSGTLVIEWGGVWAFWPVLLVLVGLSVIGGSGLGGHIASAATGIGAAALGVAFINFGDPPARAQEPSATVVTEALVPDTKHASLSLEAGVGTFVIGGGSAQLMEAEINSDPWTYSVDRDSAGGRDRVRMWTNERGGAHWPWKFRNTVEVKLNPAPSWEVNLETGASRVDADLRGLAVERLRIEAGASTLRVQLGSLAEECAVTLKTGASAVRIYVPESVGCDLRLETGLSVKRLPGFEKRTSTWYETENISAARRKIHLDIEAGVSSIRVFRVADGDGVEL
jgi:hypothetical protein